MIIGTLLGPGIDVIFILFMRRSVLKRQVPPFEDNFDVGICAIFTINKVLAYMLSPVTYANRSDISNREYALHTS